MLKEERAKELSRVTAYFREVQFKRTSGCLEKKSWWNQDLMMNFTFHMLSDRWVSCKIERFSQISKLKSGRLLLIGFLRCQYCFRYQAYKYILLFCVYYAVVAHIFLRQNGHDGEYSNHSRIQS